MCVILKTKRFLSSETFNSSDDRENILIGMPLQEILSEQPSTGRDSVYMISNSIISESVLFCFVCFACLGCLGGQIAEILQEVQRTKGIESLI